MRAWFQCIWLLGIAFAGIAVVAQPAVEPPEAPIPLVEPEDDDAPDQEPSDDDASAPKRSGPPSDAPEVTLVLADGQRITGLRVDATPASVTLWIQGVEVRYWVSEIARQYEHPPIEERYRSMREAAGGNATMLLELAGWLRGIGRYEWALAEVNRVLKLEPHLDDALQMRLEIEAQMELAKRAGRGRARESKPKQQSARDIIDSYPLLSEEQINLIKVYEVDLRRPPRLLVERETIDRLLSDYRDDPLMPRTQEGREALYRAPPERVLSLMFRMRARELYGDVRVVGQLPSMRKFRDDINRGWLTNICASTDCHGGGARGGLWLFNRKPSSERTLFTNYLVLERFRLADDPDDGSLGAGVGAPLLNFDNPDKSLLIELALDRRESTRPHPEVLHPISGRDQWRPVFRTRRDRRVARFARWLESMYRPHPAYPIDFEPPVPGLEGGETEPEAR